MQLGEWPDGPMDMDTGTDMHTHTHTQVQAQPGVKSRAALHRLLPTTLLHHPGPVPCPSVTGPDVRTPHGAVAETLVRITVWATAQDSQDSRRALAHREEVATGTLPQDSKCLLLRLPEGHEP